MLHVFFFLSPSFFRGVSIYLSLEKMKDEHISQSITSELQNWLVSLNLQEWLFLIIAFMYVCVDEVDNIRSDS